MRDAVELMTEPPRLHDRASESLAFIRTTMARSAAFTGVPGRGGVGMGVIALVAAVVAHRQHDARIWLTVWLTAAWLAAMVGLLAMWLKARRHGLPLWSASGRRFAQAFAPSLVAGAVLTVALMRADRPDLLPATWLLLYGSGVVAGAVASLPVLAWIGAALMALGGAAAVTPVAWGDAWMALGFGVVHIAFGIVIVRKHGG